MEFLNNVTTVHVICAHAKFQTDQALCLYSGSDSSIDSKIDANKSPLFESTKPRVRYLTKSRDPIACNGICRCANLNILSSGVDGVRDWSCATGINFSSFHMTIYVHFPSWKRPPVHNHHAN